MPCFSGIKDHIGPKMLDDLIVIRSNDLLTVWHTDSCDCVRHREYQEDKEAHDKHRVLSRLLLMMLMKANETRCACVCA